MMSGKKTKYWCVVPGCRSDSRKDVSKYPFMRGITFLTFPKKSKKFLRRKWIDAIRRPLDYKPQAWHRVCSLHFDSSMDYPTLFPWNNYGVETSTRPDTSIKKRTSNASIDLIDSDICLPIDEPADPVVPLTALNYSKEDLVEGPIFIKEYEVRTTTTHENLFGDHSYDVTSKESLTNKEAATSKDATTQTDMLSSDIDIMLHENLSFREKLDHKDKILRETFMEKVTCSDKQVKYYTGMTNLSVFNGIFNLLDENESKLKYYSGKDSVGEKNYQNNGKKPGPDRKLSRFEEYTLTLIRLKHALPVIMLANLFGVSGSRVSQVFTTWIIFMSSVFSQLIVWPSSDLVKKHMPKSFRKSFPKTTAIIDCTELYIQRPRNPSVQAKTYSAYKSHNTYKCLVSITPTGAFNFVSDLWGGNASDKYITQHSGFLDLISPGDMVMADRGFIIRDLLASKQAYLTIPPFTRSCSWGKGKRLNAVEIVKTRNIARLRIHVERAIQRLKQFKMLSQVIHWSLKPLANPMLKVSAFLCNLLKPLVKS